MLEVPGAVGIRGQIQDRVLKHKGLDDPLPVQERSGVEFGLDPRHLNNIAGRKYRRIFHAYMIDVNRYGKKCECQAPDFNLLTSFFLEVGDHPRSIAIHVQERGYNENEREQKYCGDSRNNRSRLAAHGRSDSSDRWSD